MVYRQHGILGQLGTGSTQCGSGTGWAGSAWRPVASYPPPRLLEAWLRKPGIVPCICALLARRAAAVACGGFDESIQDLYEDQVFLAKMVLAGPVLVEPGCGERYRQHDWVDLRAGDRGPDGTTPPDRTSRGGRSCSGSTDYVARQPAGGDVRLRHAALRAAQRPYRAIEPRSAGQHVAGSWSGWRACAPRPRRSGRSPAGRRRRAPSPVSRGPAQAAATSTGGSPAPRRLARTGRLRRSPLVGRDHLAHRVPAPVPRLSASSRRRASGTRAPARARARGRSRGRSRGGRCRRASGSRCRRPATCGRVAERGLDAPAGSGASPGRGPRRSRRRRPRRRR